MKLIQCDKGHYYDKERFESCPYCDTDSESGVTVPLRNGAGGEPESRRKNPVEAVPSAAPVQQTSGPVDSAPISAQPASIQPPQPVSVQPEQFAAAQQWRMPQEQENTWKMPENDNHTVSYYSRMLGKDPVVGWLVAVEGAYYGEAFQLKTGRNFIGRSPEMDVQLSLDMSVSRRKHAIVVYEPRAKMYIAQPGESNELFYLNDEVVLNNVTLKAYDILSIGETKLLFVPLCGGEFSWEEWKKKGQTS